MSSEATSSPVSASTLAYLMRWPVLRLIWLKLTFSVSDVAGYRATGQVTSERRKKPFQLARGAMGYSENATDDRPRIPPGHPVSSEPGGESPNGVNRGGAGWLQNGSRSGAGKARFTHRAMDGIGWFRNFAHAGNLSVGGVFLLQKRALSLARRRPGACISSPCPRDFERACRSTAPCRWHRAIEWRRRRCSAGEPPRPEQHQCRAPDGMTAQDDTRVSCQFDVAFRNHKKRPGSRGAAGQSGRKRPTWAPDGDATNNGRQMLTLSDRVEGPAARRRISMHRKPTHPDAQGIADDGRDENGEHQRPAAKVAIEVHR